MQLGDRAGEITLLLQVIRVAGRDVRALDAQEPAQLGQRLGRVFNPEIDDPVIPRPAGADAGDDHHCRRLFAAEVSALCLGGLEGGHHPLRQWGIGGGECVGHRLPDRVFLHQVGLAAEPIAERVAGGWYALAAGVRGDVAGGIDDGALAHLGSGIAGGQRFERLLGGVARLEQFQAKWAVAEVDVRLRGHRADTGERPGHSRADLEVMRLHGDAELSGFLVARNDRVGQGAYRKSRWRTTGNRTGSRKTSSIAPLR